MDKELENWLLSKVTKKTFKMLKKEQLVTATVISQLKDNDLQQLKTQYSLSMGQFVELRGARDAVLRGEFPAHDNGSAVPSVPAPRRSSSDGTDGADESSDGIDDDAEEPGESRKEENATTGGDGDGMKADIAAKRPGVAVSTCMYIQCII